MAHATAARRDTASQCIAGLEARLRRLEDADAIRARVTRYMTLCDSLDLATPLDELLDCFTEDAVWAGKGARYGTSFGGHQGREAIGAMFRRYMGNPPHFGLNVHFLCSEHIVPTGADTARAHWVMLQTSTFADGASHLNAARLTLQMVRCTDEQWRVARFETENLFSRPVRHWNSDRLLPVPSAPESTAAPTATSA